MHSYLTKYYIPYLPKMIHSYLSISYIVNYLLQLFASENQKLLVKMLQRSHKLYFGGNCKDYFGQRYILFCINYYILFSID